MPVTGSHEAAVTKGMPAQANPNSHVLMVFRVMFSPLFRRQPVDYPAFAAYEVSTYIDTRRNHWLAYPRSSRKIQPLGHS